MGLKETCQNPKVKWTVVGLVVVGVIVATVTGVLIHDRNERESRIPPHSAATCIITGNPTAASREVCEGTGCIWAPSHDDADTYRCFLPPYGVHGYTQNGPTTEVGEGVFRAELDLKDSSVHIVEAMKERLQVEVTQYGDQLLRIKVTVPDETRYEPPVPLDLPATAVSATFNVSFSDGDNNFGVVVRRADTGTALLDMRIGGFVFAEQLLQVTTRLASPHLYGLGESTHDSFLHDLSYRTWPMFARDQPPGDSGKNQYGAHPVFLVMEDDGRAHAILWLNSNAMEAETLPTPGLTLRAVGGVVDLLVFPGPSPALALSQYTSVMGRPVMPAYWSLGFQLCRYGYETLDDLKAAVDRTRRHGIPQDVQYCDIDYMDRRMDFTYDKVNYAGLPEYIRAVKEDGLRFIVILDPAINAEMSAEEYPVHERAMDQDVYVKWPEDMIPDENFGQGDVMLGYVWPDNRTAFPDFFKNSTRGWWKDEIMRLHQTLEFDGLWIDMNEPANFGTNEEQPWNWPEGTDPWSLQCPSNQWDDPPYPTSAATAWGPDKRLADKTLCMAGEQGDEGEYVHYNVHNLYGWSQTLPTLQALQEVTGRRGIVVTRSTFPGSGRWAGHWLGDNTSIWSHLRQSIIGMLEFNLFGIPYIGADICGFFGNTTEELCERWMELGAFYPFSRNHNSINYMDQDPGLWPSVASSGRAALRVRYTLLPYLYTLHHLAHTTGAGVLNPLLFEFPKDAGARSVDDQFLWGSWLMVAPVVAEGQSSRYVYFPAGVWYDYYTGEARMLEAGEPMVVPAPRSHVPLYVRGGGVLVTQRPRVNTMLSRGEPLGLVVAADTEGAATGTFYWDDGEAIDPLGSGDYLTADITYDQIRGIRWRVTHGWTQAEGMVLSDVRVFGVTSRPTQLLLNGDRWTKGDWHYHPVNQTLELFDLQIGIQKSFTLSWSANKNFRFPCPISYKDWRDGDQVTKEMCLQRNCVYDDAQQVSCALPPPTDYGFEFWDGVVTQTEGGGVRVKLSKRGPSLFGGELNDVTFESFPLGDNTLRFKLYDGSSPRYEVPLELSLPSAGAQQPLYRLVLPPDPAPGDLFWFYVERTDTGNILFDTRVGGLTFADQFLSVTSMLPSKNVYGLGENAHDTFRHDLSAARVWPIFARDQGPVPGAGLEVNLYGAHPYYQCLENDGRAHGVLLLNSNAMDYQLMDYPSITLRSIGGVLDLFMFLGPHPEQVTAQYTALIHRPVMPPYWGLGFQLCRYGYETLDDMQAAVNRTRAVGIPQDVQYGDIDYMDRYKVFTVDEERYAGFQDYVTQVKGDGLRFIVILDPAINVELTPQEYPTHANAMAANAYITWANDTDPSYIVENHEGVDDIGMVMLGYVWPENRTAFPNFFKEATQTWWRNEIETFYQEIKFDGLWIDMNEPANFGTNEEQPWNWPEGKDPWSLQCPSSQWDDPPYVTKAAEMAEDGSPHRMSDKTVCLAADQEPYRHYDVHNLYGWSQTPATQSAVMEVTGGRGMVVTRSTFPGSGRWSGHWLGDNRSNWTDMAASIVGMLEFNLFGIPYIGADICGFFGDTTEELCERWMELGAFYPFSRNHNSKGYADQDPGIWPETVANSSRRALEVRYTLLPYLYTLFYQAHTQGSTVIRPLLHEFPYDRRTYDVDTQFLWGGGLLVSPVLVQGATERRAYFPYDAWYDYYTGAAVSPPGEEHTLDAPRHHIPVHVRGGHILPTQQPALNTQQSRTQPLGALVALGLDRRAHGWLFWDDGEGVDTIAKDQYSLVDLVFVQNVLSLRVERDGAGDLANLTLSTLTFLGVELQPTQVLRNTQPVLESSLNYEVDSRRLTVTLDPPHVLQKDLSLELKGIWHYTVDMD